MRSDLRHVPRSSAITVVKAVRAFALITALIAGASNPLSDIRQLETVPFVMKAGVVVKNVTRP